MLYAMNFPEGIKGKRSSETKHFSGARLSQARAVLRLSRQFGSGRGKKSLAAKEFSGERGRDKLPRGAGL